MKKMYVGLLLSGFVFQQTNALNWADFSLKKLFSPATTVVDFESLSPQDKWGYADSLVSNQEKLQLMADAEASKRKILDQLQALLTEYRAIQEVKRIRSAGVEQWLSLDDRVIRHDPRLKMFLKESSSGKALREMEEKYDKQIASIGSAVDRIKSSDWELKRRIQDRFDNYENERQRSFFDISRLDPRRLWNDYRNKQAAVKADIQYHSDIKEANALIDAQRGKAFDDYVDLKRDSENKEAKEKRDASIKKLVGQTN